MGIWSRLGKADFSQCAAIISRFDPALRNSLKLSPGRVLQKALQYMWKKSERLGADVWWCDFSQGYVAQSIGRSRSTVSRALDRLEEMGLLERTFRRPLPGQQWQTCLYRPGKLLKAVLARIAGQVREKSPCSISAAQGFRKKTLRKDDALRNASSSFQKTQNNEEARPQHVFTDGWGAQEEQWTAERADPEQARAGFAKLKAVLAATLGQTRKARPLRPSAG
jgi:DNA-binding transcriptional MocR family regulator